MKVIILKVIFLITVVAMIFSYSSYPVLAIDIQSSVPSGVQFEDLELAINEYAKEYVDNTTAGAAVAVLQNDEIIFKNCYGYADIENSILVDDNTIFEWGSTTKLLVWVSVMQLYEQGKLDLNADIRIYLPNNFFRKLQYDKPITMLNLMNHNAGWEEHLTDVFYSSLEDISSLSEMIKIFEPNQINKPGEVVAYSNYGAALAGYIVEQITDMDFYQYVKENIFEVLAMNDTTLNPLMNDNARVKETRYYTKGYSLSKEGFIERPTLYVGCYPAGGAVGTLSDMCKFVGALVPEEGEESKLFKNLETLELMLSKSYEPTEDFPGICHGLWEHYYTEKVIEHGGNTDSFSSHISIAPESGIAVVVLTNQAHERAMCYGIKDMVFGKYIPDEYNEELPSSEILEGMYQSYRRTYSGFSQWLNLVVSEVSVIDDNTIDLDGNIYTQIRPYVYQYTDSNGASELIYFNVENGQVKSIYQQYGEWEYVEELEINFKLITVFSFIAIGIYFLVYTIILIVKYIRRRSINNRNIAITTIAGAISFINTFILLIRATTYPSYIDIKIHFLINILFIITTTIIIIMKIIEIFRRSVGERIGFGEILLNIIPVIYVILIIGCQFYK